MREGSTNRHDVELARLAYATAREQRRAARLQTQAATAIAVAAFADSLARLLG